MSEVRLLRLDFMLKREEWWLARELRKRKLRKK
jgi:hypothetical protein